jgi:membrane protein implicated in regulation of membrane protease activity
MKLRRFPDQEILAMFAVAIVSFVAAISSMLSFEIRLQILYAASVTFLYFHRRWIKRAEKQWSSLSRKEDRKSEARRRLVKDRDGLR